MSVAMRPVGGQAIASGSILSADLQRYDEAVDGSPRCTICRRAERRIQGRLVAGGGLTRLNVLQPRPGVRGPGPKVGEMALCGSCLRSIGGG